ncbi:MAG: hypothetical protein ACRDIL_04330 [Candidatus Limnocylindrales bacterium]
MNEQGIAWMIAGGDHDPSPEDLRQREQRRALASSQRPRPRLHERLTAVITGRTSGPAAATSTHSCPA